MKKTVAICSAVLALAGNSQSSGQSPVVIDLNPSHQEFKERSVCSDYLRMLPPLIIRKLGFADDVASELRSVGQRRFEQQNARISEMQSAGVDIEDAHDRLIRFDNELAKSQFDELQRLLTPNELDSLMREYFRTYLFEKLLDPLAAQWLSITTEELAAIAEMHNDYQTALTKASRRINRNTPLSHARNESRVSRITFGGNLTPEMKAMQKELAQLEARRWSVVTGKKLEMCFKKIGFISNDETLADYLSRNTDRSEVYIDELPAFAIAQLRAEADAQRNR